MKLYLAITSLLWNKNVPGLNQFYKNWIITFKGSMGRDSFSILTGKVVLICVFAHVERNIVLYVCVCLYLTAF